MEPPPFLTATTSTTKTHGAPAAGLQAELSTAKEDETSRSQTQWYLSLSAASHKPPAALVSQMMKKDSPTYPHAFAGLAFSSCD